MHSLFQNCPSEMSRHLTWKNPVNIYASFMADNESSEVACPREGAVHFLSLSVSSEFSPILAFFLRCEQIRSIPRSSSFLRRGSLS